MILSDHDYEWGEGDLYNSDGEPHDMCFPYSLYIYHGIIS